MIKVVTTIPKQRLERYGVEVPNGVDLVYKSSRSSQEELLEAARDAEVIFSSLTEISKELIEGCKNLKLIQSEGVGFDEIDIEAARDNGVYVANARGVNKDGVAEFTLGLMIDLLRGISRSNKAVLESRYSDFYRDYEKAEIRNLKDCRVGLIGMGDIGQEVLKRLVPFTDDIVYFNRSRKEDLEEKHGITYLRLEELYRTCDIISLHLPLNDETKNMINKDSMALMKEDAILINTARGDLINQKDLAEALNKGKIAGAALDTISPEPPSEDHPLLNLDKEIEDNLLVTTHIAGVTGSAMENMQKIGWSNIEKIRLGQRPDYIVNKL